MKPTWRYIRAVLGYQPSSGVLTWKPRPRSMFKTHRAFAVWRTRFAGQPAFACSTEPIPGYQVYCGRLRGRNYRAHQIIWFWMTGRWAAEIDHINGDTLDNRWCNLAAIAHGKNQQRGMLRRSLEGKRARFSRPLRFKHVGIDAYRVADGTRYTAYLTIGGKRHRSKSHRTIKEAIAARKELERRFAFDLAYQP